MHVSTWSQARSEKQLSGCFAVIFHADPNSCQMQVTNKHPGQFDRLTTVALCILHPLIYMRCPQMLEDWRYYSPEIWHLAKKNNKKSDSLSYSGAHVGFYHHFPRNLGTAPLGQMPWACTEEFLGSWWGHKLKSVF